MENLSSLTALSPLDGRYRAKIAELENYFSEYALIKYRIKIEIEWLIALADRPEIENLKAFSAGQIEGLREIYQELSPQIATKVKDIEATTNHDVKAVEYFIHQKLEEIGLEEAKTFVHFACTSEDINNLSYALMVKDALEEILLPHFSDLMEKVKAKAEEYRHSAMMAKTHGQPASPTTMGKEFFNVHQRFQRQHKQLRSQEVLGKINGAVGNFNAHLVAFPDLDWAGFTQEFVEGLGLTYNPATTQIEPHDFLAEIFQTTARWNTILIDFSRDLWFYISLEYFKQRAIAGQVGSSTMPHKVNPIDFENAEGNLGMANAVFEFLARKLPRSRLQRDLTDSTVLRNIGVGFGYSLLAVDSFCKGLGKLSLNQDKMTAELSGAWSLLGEALQTVMRKHLVPDAYEKLKELTRGKQIDQEGLARFLETLDLPEEEKQRLKKLTPQAYLGAATEFRF